MANVGSDLTTGPVPHCAIIGGVELGETTFGEKSGDAVISARCSMLYPDVLGVFCALCSVSLFSVFAEHQKRERDQFSLEWKMYRTTERRSVNTRHSTILYTSRIFITLVTKT